MKQGNTGKSRTKKIVLIVLCVVLALILAAAIFVAVYLENLFGMLNRVETVAPTAPAATVAAPATTPTKPDETQATTAPTTPTETTVPEVKDNTINILLVGADSGGNLSDSMILCTVHTGAKTINLTSFLRDTYVDIPDYFPHKLNTSYSLGGFSVLDSALTSNFGVPIDGNVAVNFDSFVEVIDAVGGVDIELTEDEVWYLAGYFGWWDLEEGVNHLDGEQCLHYSRIRSIDGDANRANRQRIVISALLDKAKSLSIKEMNNLIFTVLPMITTDLSNAQITNYAMELLPLLKDLTISTQQIPAEGTYHLDWVEQDGGMSVIEIDDWQTNLYILNAIIEGK